MIRLVHPKTLLAPLRAELCNEGVFQIFSSGTLPQTRSDQEPGENNVKDLYFLDTMIKEFGQF